MKQRSDKRIEAGTRQEAYSKLSIDQKLKSLDAEFGKGKGAKKVRKKLLLAKQKQKKKDKAKEKNENSKSV